MWIVLAVFMAIGLYLARQNYDSKTQGLVGWVVFFTSLGWLIPIMLIGDEYELVSEILNKDIITDWDIFFIFAVLAHHGFIVMSNIDHENAFNALPKEAQSWFTDQGMKPSIVVFFRYNGDKLTKHAGALILVGVCQTHLGDECGFAIEIIDDKGVVAGDILEPRSIVTQHDKARLIALQTNTALIDVLQDMAHAHRLKHGTSNPQPTQPNPQKEQKTPQQSPVAKAQVRPTAPPKPKVLPFGIKPSITTPAQADLFGDFSEQSIIRAIKILALRELHHHLNNPSHDYKIVQVNYDKAVFNDGKDELSICHGIGFVAHDYVYQLISQNTTLNPVHQLPYHQDYGTILVDIMGDFDESNLAFGIHRYVESLVDYYLEQL